MVILLVNSALEANCQRPSPAALSRLFPGFRMRLSNGGWVARGKALVVAFVDQPLAMLRIVGFGMRWHLRVADLGRRRPLAFLGHDRSSGSASDVTSAAFHATAARDAFPRDKLGRDESEHLPC